MCLHAVSLHLYNCDIRYFSLDVFKKILKRCGWSFADQRSAEIYDDMRNEE